MEWGKKREYDKAIADHKQAIKLNPKNERAYNHRGIAWKNKRKFDGGLTAVSVIQKRYSKVLSNRAIQPCYSILSVRSKIPDSTVSKSSPIRPAPPPSVAQAITSNAITAAPSKTSAYSVVA